MLLVSWNVVTPCVHRQITGHKPNSSISSLVSLLLPILSNLYEWTSESKQLVQICKCPHIVAYQCSCLNPPPISILLTDQALTFSTYKTLIWKVMYFAATIQLQQFMEDLTNKWNYLNYTVPYLCILVLLVYVHGNTWNYITVQ
jgi:hypothetical protein